MNDPAAWLVARNRYGHYCVPKDSAHRPAARAILSGVVWEPRTLEFMIRHMGAGDVVHAGAYFGDCLPALSAAISPQARVWAFEPNPVNYLATVLTCRLNGLRNIELKNYALGDRCRSARLRVKRGAETLGGGSLIAKDPAAVPENELLNVAMTTVDACVPGGRRVSLIHLDVELSETEALVGAARTIQTCKPILVLEELPGSKWVEACSRQLGYRIVGKCDGNVVLSA